ncbi:MAG: hypothetical protein AB7V46_05420, partial [Thermomicrobiales bacterium]
QSTLAMLGSGSTMSVLIGAGGARLLLLDGTDPADFGNALKKESVPLLNRVDIVIVSNQEAGSTFVHTALDQVEYERLSVIGDSTGLLDAGVAVREQIRHSLEIRMPDQVSVMIQRGTDSGDDQPGWYATLSNGSIRILLTAGQPTTSMSSLTGPIAAWIQIDDRMPDPEVLRSLVPRAIYVPAATVSGREFAQRVPSEGGWDPLRFRVHAGDAIKLNL